ncbi:hypothetical protein [Nocardia sp. NPDC052566]|uniref:hypothetical protein n=1 Tax=Nocardia sp. NPDC052566 TaxID=3364330 RepID=UPI0037C909E5
MIRWTLVADVLLAVAAALLGYLQRDSPWTGLLPGSAPYVAVLAGIALLFRKRYPFAVLAVAVAAVALSWMTVPLMLAVFTVAARNGNRRSTWSAIAAAMVCSAIPWGGPWTAGDFLSASILSGIATAAPALLGLWLHQRRELAELQRRHAAAVERDELAAAATVRQWSRIARELQEVVEYRLSQITDQAETLEADTVGAPARRAAAIADSGTAALAEMRDLLDTLPDDPHTPPPAAPALDGVRELLDGASAAGQRLRTSLPAVMPAVPSRVGHAVYRMIRDCLALLAEHTADAEIWVRVGGNANVLTVLVRGDQGCSHDGRVTALCDHIERSGGTVSTRIDHNTFQVFAVFDQAAALERTTRSG